MRNISSRVKASIFTSERTGVDSGFPVIAFASQDQAEAPLAEVADALADKGAMVFATSQIVEKAIALPVVRTGHSLTDPIALIASFYAMGDTPYATEDHALLIAQIQNLPKNNALFAVHLGDIKTGSSK